jgi:anti-sigma regulatory factor (Ser/Thr protein kinase)
MYFDGPGPSIEIPLHQDPCAPREARAALRALLSLWEDREQAADAELVVSELVSNVLTHTTALGVLRAWGTEVGLHVEVTDDDQHLPRLGQPAPGQVGGLGLHVVEQLSSAWGVAPSAHGKCVWADVPRRRPSRPVTGTGRC